MSDKIIKVEDLSNLDEHLKNHSYLGGFTPSKADSSIYEYMLKEKLEASLSKYDNISRWFNHIKSFNNSERQQFFVVNMENLNINGITLETVSKKNFPCNSKTTLETVSKKNVPCNSKTEVSIS